MKPKVLIPYGFGLNCEDETEYAFKSAGANVDKIHLKYLFDKPNPLSNYHLLAFVGGFSFGDHISAGKVLGNLYRLKLGEEIRRFLSDGKLIFGECNGFQVMAKSGILPSFDGENNIQNVTLMNNDSGVFEDRWVQLNVNQKSKCIFTKNIRHIYLPVRHGEGKFVTKDQTVLERLKENNQIVIQYVNDKKQPTMEYPMNPNGSVEAIAGICDPTGRVFGLMPHPTAYLTVFNHPRYYKMKRNGQIEPAQGTSIFKNATQYIERELC